MNLHVIIGDDDYLVGETAKKIVGDGVGLEVIDSINSTNADLQLADLRRVDESVSSPPFLDPRKVTWWKNVGFLPGGKSSEEVKVAIEKFVAKLVKFDLPDNQHFILSATTLLKTSVVAKTLATKAEMVVFSASGKPWELTRNAIARVRDAAAEMGLTFAFGAEDKFVATVGTDTRSLLSELNKMRCYLGDERAVIKSEDIAAITSAGIVDEPPTWNLADAIGERNLAKALDELRKFDNEDSGFAVWMSGVIERQFRQMVDYAMRLKTMGSDAASMGLTPAQARKMPNFIRNWNLLELRRARARFLALREKVVSGTEAGNVMVVTELVRAMRRK